MKIILLVIGIVFVVNSNFAFAKDMYFDCHGEGSFKYSKSWFGKDKLFWEKGAEWVRDKNAKITDDKLISTNWEYGKSSSCNRFDPCRYKHVISLILRKKAPNRVSVKHYRLVTSKKCSFDADWRGCLELSAGDKLPDTSSCSVFEQ